MLSKLLNNGVFLVCWRQLVGNLASDPFCTLSVLPCTQTQIQSCGLFLGQLLPT